LRSHQELPRMKRLALLELPGVSRDEQSRRR
jgi:hypothetical protein